jgi:aldehyde dehydrogenase (NAD+)
VCIAPDYVLVDQSVRASFVEKLRANAVGDSGLLVNDRHAARIQRLSDDKVDGRQVSLKILENVPSGAPVMEEEIFGPLLPIIPYRDLAEALKIVNEREKPLVLYLFSRNREVIDTVLRETRAGGSVINDTLVHFYQLNLPFGGVGQSGIGKAHGRFGFEAFSNARGVLEQPTRFSGIQLLYPPYTRLKQKLIDFALRYL